MNVQAKDSSTLEAEMQAMGRAARDAAAALREASSEQKNEALLAAATAIRAVQAEILAANEQDMQAGAARDLTPALMDRLKLDAKRIEATAQAVSDVASLPDPVGRELARWQRPNGLDIARISTPIGVIGIIYESRPNVTADAGALCLKSGNVVDPARRFGIAPFVARDPRGAGGRSAKRPAFPPLPSSSCRPPTAPLSGICSRG